VIVAFSTSSPVASVAILGSDGAVLFEEHAESRHQTSGTCLAMLDRGLRVCGVSLPQVTHFAADVGPGSFIGTRVGIVLAKTLAYAQLAQCLAADSFDLVSTTATVVLPSKRGEYFVRRVGEVPYRTEELPSGELLGYGLPPGWDANYPQASGFAGLWRELAPIEPTFLSAIPLIEPSISMPKVPYREVASGA
jgi:tRNA threonylcarbamoyl adenosine modification protein YeaZ